MSAGPVITPIRRWPRDSRCSVAASPPGPVGRADRRDVRRRRVGRVDHDERDARAAQLPDLRAVSVVVTRITPSGVVAGDRRRPAGRPGVAVPDGGHRDRGGVLRAPLLDPAQDLHRPRAVQAREHEVDEPGAACGRCPLRRYWCWTRSCSTRARVDGATSGRPFTTLDTVGSDTPASAAIAASVVFRTASPFDQFRNFSELRDRFTDPSLFMLHRTAINKQLKTFVTLGNEG